MGYDKELAQRPLTGDEMDICILQEREQRHIIGKGEYEGCLIIPEKEYRELEDMYYELVEKINVELHKYTEEELRGMNKKPQAVYITPLKASEQHCFDWDSIKGWKICYGVTLCDLTLFDLYGSREMLVLSDNILISIESYNEYYTAYDKEPELVLNNEKEYYQTLTNKVYEYYIEDYYTEEEHNES